MSQKYQFIYHSDFEFKVDTSVLSLELVCVQNPTMHRVLTFDTFSRPDTISYLPDSSCGVSDY